MGFVDREGKKPEVRCVVEICGFGANIVAFRAGAGEQEQKQE